MLQPKAWWGLPWILLQAGVYACKAGRMMPDDDVESLTEQSESVLNGEWLHHNEACRSCRRVQGDA